MLIFVDEIMGVCLRKDLPHEMNTAKTICTDLLGPNAVADNKTKSGRRLDLIGYVIDLDNKLLSIARKNFLNTVYGFYTVNTEAKVRVMTTIPFAQKLASWASRYSMIFRHMRPLAPHCIWRHAEDLTEQYISNSDLRPNGRIKCGAQH